MTFRKSLNYKELPEKLSMLVAEANFLEAYDCSKEFGSLIVWLENRDFNRSDEIEYSLSLSRILSVEERQHALPAPEEIVIDGLDYRVIKSSRIEDGSNMRYEVYDVFSNDLKDKITTCEQLYFLYVQPNAGNIVGSAVKTALFPMTYAKWSLDDRVAYWSSQLYLFRRQIGEEGEEEDAIFDMDLVNRMKLIDPDIEKILHLVISKLAEMNMTSPVSLIKSFNEKMGLNISL